MITYGTTSDALFVLSGTFVPTGVANRGCSTAAAVQLITVLTNHNLNVRFRANCSRSKSINYELVNSRLDAFAGSRNRFGIGNGDFAESLSVFQNRFC